MKAICALLVLLMAAPLAAETYSAPANPIYSSIEGAVEKRMGQQIRKNQRDIVLLQAENLLTRVTGDATAWRIGTGAADLTTTGWAIAEGANEGNALLGGSRNSALIIIGTKVAVIALEYWKDRHSGENYKECIVKAYDAYTGEDCEKHIRAIKMRRNVFSGARVIVSAWNGYQIAQSVSDDE